MAFKIAVASGKGGTGKTTIAVNLYHAITTYLTDNIELVDCDVEEPNDALFFNKAKEINKDKIERFLPKIDMNQCTFCNKCIDYCEFNSITMLPMASFAEVNANLCHSCKACIYICDTGSISADKEIIGEIRQIDVGYGKGLKEGRLKIGSTMQTLMIKETKKKADLYNEVIIYDAPPGVSCSFVETIADVDYVILVTEPTPFGFHDLLLTIDVLNEMKISFGIIINKAYHTQYDIENQLINLDYPILSKIPFDKEYASQYAKGKIVENSSMAIYYYAIIDQLKEIIKCHNSKKY